MRKAQGISTEEAQTSLVQGISTDDTKKWVCLKIVYPFLPNGFADHYPKNKWLFVWEYTLFSDKPKYKYVIYNSSDYNYTIPVIYIDEILTIRYYKYFWFSFWLWFSF